MSCTEERDEGSRSAARWRGEVHGLEKSNAETRQLISILEEDIRASRKECEALQSNAAKLDGEKQQVRGPLDGQLMHRFNCSIEMLQMRFKSNSEV